MTAKLMVVGGGRMGEALVRGLVASGWAQPHELVVVEASAARRAELGGEGGIAGAYPGLQVAAEPQPAEGAVVAVKPADVEQVCKRLAGTAAAGPGGPLVPRALSVAAGVALADLEAWCGPSIAVVRAMPNTPALVGAAATAIAGGAGAGADDLAWAAGVMGAVGTVVEVAEPLLDAVTGLSGSGPAYVFLVAEALADAGVLAGLPRAMALQLVTQTLLGSARLLAETGEGPEALRAAVTSPAGTTAAGLRELERHGTRAAFIEAVSAATRRSRELGTAGRDGAP